MRASPREQAHKSASAVREARGSHSSVRRDAVKFHNVGLERDGCVFGREETHSHTSPGLVGI
jgi:hypothetical protein